ncbi:MAG: UvrB/UvrC motif-containing protein, partial [Acutalibacteraceae bacterium]|nr:UvrB/UvrC motif-containing protein [Acutalibacteraceae bacterium]
TIIKDVSEVLEISSGADSVKADKQLSRVEREQFIKQLTAEMKAAAKILEFEHAAQLRDRIEKLRRGK